MMSYVIFALHLSIFIVDYDLFSPPTSTILATNASPPGTQPVINNVSLLSGASTRVDLPTISRSDPMLVSGNSFVYNIWIYCS